jgi:hypothetical protein
MIYELRTYRVMPGQMPKLLSRFRDHTIQIWERLGIRPVGFWTTEIGESVNGELNYLLAWDSLAHREAQWTAYQTDPVWKAVKADSEKDGPFVANIRNQMLLPTDFSAMH